MCGELVKILYAFGTWPAANIRSTNFTRMYYEIEITNFSYLFSLLLLFLFSHFPSCLRCNIIRPLLLVSFRLWVFFLRWQRMDETTRPTSSRPDSMKRTFTARIERYFWRSGDDTVYDVRAQVLFVWNRILCQEISIKLSLRGIPGQECIRFGLWLHISIVANLLRCSVFCFVSAAAKMHWHWRTKNNLNFHRYIDCTVKYMRRWIMIMKMGPTEWANTSSKEVHNCDFPARYDRHKF